MGLAPKTVGNHVSEIFAKPRVASRAEAIVRAREGGLGASGDRYAKRDRVVTARVLRSSLVRLPITVAFGPTGRQSRR